MSKRLICLVLCVTMILGSVISVSAQEQKDIFYILNTERFLEFAENCRLDSYSRDLTVMLCRDIDLSGTGFTGIPTFSGTFEGNGHRIFGLQIDAEGSNLGLFRYLTETAVVRDLRIMGFVTPDGSANVIGSLAGNNAGTIENCSFEGKVSGTDSIGGLVGINQLTGVISQSTVAGTVTGHHFVGGIAGNNYGVIKDCENRAQVNTSIEQNDVDLEDITLNSITHSESAVTVTDIGGICGTGTGVIRNCDNYGSIGYPQVGYNVGGIAGSWSGYLNRCTNHAAVDGRKEVGGIVGQLEPAVNMIYEEDTLQTLQQQMDGLSNTAGGIGASIEGGSNALNNQSQQMAQQLKDAQDALKVLMPDEDTGDYVPPDEESIQAAKNALSSSLSELTGSVGTMAEISKNTLGSVVGNLQAMTGQMSAISSTIGTASENLGGSIRDVSDNDTEDDLTAKIQGCHNLGRVQGDWNIGGIAGAVGLENDLDPESDLQIIGNTSLNFDMELRAVILECNNEGTIYGKKQNVGGIAGWISMGLTKGCVNTAAIEGSTADYAGGIAGQSNGFIRHCHAKCFLSGETHTGGIAGMATTVTECRSMISFGSFGEKTGAILGASEAADLQANYYLPIGKDLGAIDGISYAGSAEPLSARKFFELDFLPDNFENITVTFQYDDTTSHHRLFPYGTTLTPEMIPAIPKDKGAEAYWSGDIQPGDQLLFDTTFTLTYTDYVQTLESSEQGHNGPPLFLAQGQFSKDAVLTVSPVDDTGALVSYKLEIPNSKIPVRLRCRMPDGVGADHITLLVQTGTGWQETEYSVDGSYLVFDAPEGTQALRIKEMAVNHTPYILAGTAAATAAILIAAIILIVRRRKTKRT